MPPLAVDALRGAVKNPLAIVLAEIVHGDAAEVRHMGIAAGRLSDVRSPHHPIGAEQSGDTRDHRPEIDPGFLQPAERDRRELDRRAVETRDLLQQGIDAVVGGPASLLIAAK